MNITIAGIGALGSLFGVMLHSVARKYDIRLQMFGHWPAQIAALNNGLKVIDEAATATVWQLNAVDQPEKLHRADVLIVLVKSWQTQQTAAEIASSVKPGGVVLTLQNGLGNEELLRAVVPGAIVFGGLTTCGAYLLDAGVLQKGGGGKVLIAENPAAAVQLQVLQSALRDAGCTVELTDNIEHYRWQKLIVNAAINPVSAIYRLPNGALLSVKEIAARMERITSEAVKVAQAVGMGISKAQAWQAVVEVCRATPNNRSSMLQDVLQQRPTEIAAITGQIIRKAREHGIAVAENEAVYRNIREIEAAYQLNKSGVQ
jgi:2-dehydropantoate 2-reductase